MIDMKDNQLLLRKIPKYTQSHLSTMVKNKLKSKNLNLPKWMNPFDRYKPEEQEKKEKQYGKRSKQNA